MDAVTQQAFVLVQNLSEGTRYRDEAPQVLFLFQVTVLFFKVHVVFLYKDIVPRIVEEGVCSLAVNQDLLIGAINHETDNVVPIRGSLITLLYVIVAL